MADKPRNLTTADLEHICDRVAKASKAAFDQVIASRDARISQLEADLSTIRAALGQ
jgi:hypothetical protein